VDCAAAALDCVETGGGFCRGRLWTVEKRAVDSAEVGCRLCRGSLWIVQRLTVGCTGKQ
jgi:hypothetical protein